MAWYLLLRLETWEEHEKEWLWGRGMMPNIPGKEATYQLNFLHCGRAV
jgi:hypothetical protein